MSYGHVADRRGAGSHERFSIGEGVERPAGCRVYPRKETDPIWRRLRIFALDPSAARFDGKVAEVNVSFEPIDGDFRGELFEIDPVDEGSKTTYDLLALDDRAILLASGRTPSPSDPLFHQQMVYAVCMRTHRAFRRALGRLPVWGFDLRPGAEGASRLRLRPWGLGENRNAVYDKAHGDLSFGYAKADGRSSGSAAPSGYVFTCLSHDIVVHEVTHALVDGLRSHFARPTGPDVLAFHEGFADLVAVLQKFSYREVVEAAIQKAGGQLEVATLLTQIAMEFGAVLDESSAETTDKPRPRDRGLRSAIDPEGHLVYEPSRPPHRLGSVLVSAVFDTFVTVFKRKTARFVRLATGGTGRLPPGDLPKDLLELLAAEASKLAEQILTICIRALDYCPPVDIEFGEFLRAVITADHALVSEDPWGYREAWIDSFRQRGIFPHGVRFLAEDTLRWDAPDRALEPIARLSFANLQFDGDPARPASADELREQARALGAFITRPECVETFGLVTPGDPRLRGDEAEPPCVQSIRSSRRIGPDGQIVFDLVAEVTQTRHVRSEGGLPPFDLIGGSTILIGPDGRVRFVVCKSLLSEERLLRQRSFLTEGGARFWIRGGDGTLVPRPQQFHLIHEVEGGVE